MITTNTVERDENYSINFWSPIFENDKIVFELTSILRNSFFYPAAGLDFSQINFHKSKLNSFVYVDYSCSFESVMEVSKRKNIIDGYEIFHHQKILENNEVIFGRTAQFLIKVLERKFASSPPSYFEWLKNDLRKTPFFNVTELKQIGAEDANDDFFTKSWGAEWIVYKKSIKNDSLPEYISLIYISADAVCAYKGLYSDYKTSPSILAIIQYGSSFGGAYTRLGDEDSIFGELVLCADAKPKTLICGVTTNFDNKGEKEQYFDGYYDLYKNSYECGGNNCFIWELSNLTNKKRAIKLVPNHDIAPVSSALHASIDALLSIRENPKLINGKSPKQTIKEWVKSNYQKYGLVNSKGEPSENIAEAISIVVNWSRSGGPPPTTKNRKSVKL